MTSPETVRVVAAVVERGRRWLVGRRPPEKRHGGLWEFPGGKVDEDESTLDAVRRELTEELALEVAEIGEVLFTTRDPETPFQIEFVEVSATGAAAPLEHEEVAWMSLKELRAAPLAPADRAFVEWLFERDG